MSIDEFRNAQFPPDVLNWSDQYTSVVAHSTIGSYRIKNLCVYFIPAKGRVEEKISGPHTTIEAAKRSARRHLVDNL